ncbi:hypothetical protein J2W79_003078 [Methylorubrum extorquens]|nr:hypothetical protein [Methylorubrum extorquens]
MPTTAGVFSLAGFGSMAQSVPKNVPSGSTMGIEM